MEPIPQGCVAWRAGTTTLYLLGSYPPYIVLKFQLGTPPDWESISGLFYRFTNTGSVYSQAQSTQSGNVHFLAYKQYNIEGKISLCW
jgi:hypothetical protein